MGKGASKVLAVEYLSGLWICGDVVEDKCKCIDAYMIILKGYAIARSLPLWLFLFHGTTANSISKPSILYCWKKKSIPRISYSISRREKSTLLFLFTNYYPAPLLVRTNDDEIFLGNL